MAALQVLTVHLLNHLEFDGQLVAIFKIIPGVPTFFFISGLLICTSYERTHHRGKLVFFINRSLRIYPALWVCVAISSLVLVASNYLSTQNFSINNFLFWVFAQTSIFQFYNPDFMRAFGVGVLNGSLWTIAIELQFYMLTPILYFLMTRYRIFLGLIFIFSMVLNVYLRDHLDWNLLYMKLIYVSFAPWVFMFIFGFIIAFYHELSTKILQRIGLKWLILAYIVSMLFIGPYAANASNAINPVSFILLAGCLLKLSKMRLPLPKMLVNFIAHNDLSYGIYLYHMPVLNFLLFFGLFSAFGNFLIACIIVIIAATLSWFFIEKPALRYKR